MVIQKQVDLEVRLFGVLVQLEELIGLTQVITEHLVVVEVAQTDKGRIVDHLVKRE
jgi:hypothetical protein